jgi:hypothetical protein
MSCSSPHTPLVLVQSSRRRGSPGPQQASTTEQNDFSSLWWDGPRGPKARLGPARDGVVLVPCRHAWLMCRFCAVAAYRCRISPVNLWCGRSRLRGGGGARAPCSQEMWTRHKWAGRSGTESLRQLAVELVGSWRRQGRKVIIGGHRVWNLEA